ncbi:MAG: hypothetical protein JXQ75_10980 [Phycisphaerae bacterium]|nr:hypothetical protein [Phycisphaerae bacterium]
MEEHDVDRYERLVAEIAVESDRAAAVLAVAGMDDRLRALLKKILVAQTSQSISLLRPEDPLGSFSAKIEVLYRIGLIGSDIHREFHLIRKIRNKFAHLSDEISFDNSPVSDIANDLTTPQLVAKMPSFSVSLTEVHPRDKFNLAAAFLLMLLEFLIDTTPPLKERGPTMEYFVQATFKRAEMK